MFFDLENTPENFHVVIEISKGEGEVKYEIDHKTGLVMVDRFLSAPMYYPYNYGFIPNTLAGDGDPTDVLVLTGASLIVGSVIKCRPIGVLNMSDEGGVDQKIIALPIKTFQSMDTKDISQLHEIILERIKHFFTYYKKIEKEKFVEIGDWGDREAAIKIIKDSIEAAN